MSFTIGIGVLLEEAANNRLRELELLIAQATGNWTGLGQPPHVTIKVPFEVASMEDIHKTGVLMHRLAAQTKSFPVEIYGFGNFGEQVVYGVVKNSDEFTGLSNPLIDALISDDQKREYERGRMIFHSTLGLKLNSREYKLAIKKLEQETLQLSTRAVGLGLFLGIDELKHWVVIDEVSFLQNNSMH